MLGMLAGSPMMPAELQDFGFLMIVVRPDILTDTEAFKREVAAYSDAVRATRPVAGGPLVRMPFDRSRADRAQGLERGWIEVPDTTLAALSAIGPGAR
jgi:LDH2 family malate/lactate/ureidoglycolate dehydrogenase